MGFHGWRNAGCGDCLGRGTLAGVAVFARAAVGRLSCARHGRCRAPGSGARHGGDRHGSADGNAGRWGRAGDIAARLGRVLRTAGPCSHTQFLPDPPVIAESEAREKLRRRSAWSSTLIAGLELAKQGNVVLGQRVISRQSSRIAYEIDSKFFPTDPPQFYRVAFGYDMIDPIKKSLTDAGFARIGIDVVPLKTRLTCRPSRAGWCLEARSLNRSGPEVALLPRMSPKRRRRHCARNFRTM
jgi:hypothetical protein